MGLYISSRLMGLFAGLLVGVTSGEWGMLLGVALVTGLDGILSLMLLRHH